MKKRIFSFAIMIVTLIAIIAFGVPNIITNTKTGMEYNGGFNILYEVKSDNKDLTKKELVTAASEGIEKRLDISNIIDPIVSVEGNKYVRVSVSASNQIVADEIRSVIENNAEISFRDYENNLLATGEEILEDVGATLGEENASTGYTTIILNIKDTELLGDITENVSSLSDTHLVVWLGYEEGDDYADLETDASIQKKVIYNATVSSKLTEDSISITGSFSKSQAQSTIDLINSGTLDYTLDVVQISSLESSSANSAYTKVLIASLVALAIVIIGLVVLYRTSGLTSSLCLLFSTFLTLTLFVAFKGILNQQAIAALIVSLGLFVDALIIVHERIKKELYNGKKLDKAVSEGFNKSYASIIDTSITVFILSVVMYFFGNSISTFALVLAFASVVNMIINTLVLKLSLTLFVKVNNNPLAFGAKKAYLDSKETYTNSKLNNVNVLNHKKKFNLGSLAFVGVSTIVMLVLQLTMGLMFNYNSTIKEGSNVVIITSEEYFTTESSVKDFFLDSNINIKATDVNISTYDEEEVTKYRVSFNTTDSVVKVENEIVNKLVDEIGENQDYDEKYELYINDINPISFKVSLLNALYTVGIGLLIIGVYLAIRYRYSYAIAAIVSSVCTVLFTLLFFGLTRISIGSDAVNTIFAVVVFNIATLIAIFDRLKEMITDTTKKYLSNEERNMAITKSINVTLPRTIILTIFVVLVSIALLACSTSTSYSFYLTLILGLIFSSISALMIASQIWLLFEQRSDKKKRTFKAKKKNSKFKELEEHIIIGIND